MSDEKAEMGRPSTSPPRGSRGHVPPVPSVSGDEEYARHHSIELNRDKTGVDGGRGGCAGGGGGGAFAWHPC